MGNPPWGRIKELPEIYEKFLLSEYFRSEVFLLQISDINIYKFFLEKCYVELKNNGLFSMILPATFLGESNSIPYKNRVF